MESIKNEVLFSKDDIERRVRELAGEISRDYAGKDLIVVGVLKGAFIFMADLIRQLQVPCRIDFVQLSSYGTEMISCGKVTIRKDIDLSITGQDVLVVEDILDTGLTLSHLMSVLKEREPRSLRVCVLLDKKMRREAPFTADYTGFTIEDGFVVGYGLDFNEHARSLPDIHILYDDGDAT